MIISSSLVNPAVRRFAIALEVWALTVPGWQPSNRATAQPRNRAVSPDGHTIVYPQPEIDKAGGTRPSSGGLVTGPFGQQTDFPRKLTCVSASDRGETAGDCETVQIPGNYCQVCRSCFPRSGAVFAGQLKCGGESACTPDSVVDGHPSRPAVTRRFLRSTRELSGPPAPCLTLLQVGFT